ncbi:receptor-type tyrosine-protein phosphatase mu-like, partial [Limulus polyphemus]|uniref:protein-tyrosine-phosphatase n=1 Tax=Limulus polyphemus TaxID=6850 RepID=A0ABM1BLJ7_LIMPO
MNGSCTCEGRWRGKICTENIPQIVAASDEEVNTGQPKYISCTADAIPPPSVQINSSQLSSINSEVRELNKNQYQAVVKVTVAKADDVDFFCIASNDHGFVKKTFTLHVIDPPVLKDKPKVLDVNSTSVVVGWLPWEFEKDNGGVKSDRADYMVVYREKLETQWHKLDSWQPGLSATIPNLLPDTEYEVAVRCRRQGRGGDGKPSPSVSVHTLCGKSNPNGIPQDFHGVVINTTSIQLLWNPPMLSDLQCHLLAYRLRFWKTLDSLSVQHVEINSSEESFIITNLTAYSNYTLQLYPLTSSGLGSYYASLNIITPESVPGPVQNLTYHHLPNPYNLLLTWDIPYEVHGNLKNYLINYDFIGIRDCGTSSIEDTDSSNFTTMTTQNKQITISDLHSYSNYYITVRASTAAGFGNVKELYAVTKEAAPSGVPQNVRIMTVDKNVLEFHWDPVPCDQSNGKIINYEYAIQHVPHFRSNKTRTKRKMLKRSSVVRISKTNGTTARLTGLVPFETYTFVVRGYTKVGAGPFSNKIFQKTADDVPPAPSLLLVEKSDRHMTLRIKPPNPAYGVILQYNLSYSTAENQSYDTRFLLINSMVQNDNDTGASKIYQLQNLLPYTQYFIKTQASTRVGWGYWSETVTVLTEESLPGPPTQIKLVSRTNSSIEISWAPPNKPNGIITMYQVKCQPMSTADPQYQLEKLIVDSINVSATRRSYEFTHLHHSTAYQFQVWAFTQVGYGQEVEAVYWTEFAEIDAPPKAIILNDYVTESSVPIIFTPADHIGVKKYQIIVEKADNKAGIDETKLQDYKGSVENNITYYITAELDASEVSKHRRFYFIVGDEKNYGRFMNVALRTGERYNIRIRTIAQLDMEEKSRSAISFPQSSVKVGGPEIQKDERHILGMPWLYLMFIMLGIFVFLAVMFLFLGLFFSRRKKSVQCHKTTNGFAQPEISDAMTWSVTYKVPECQATDSPLVETSQPIILSRENGSLTKRGKGKSVHSSTSILVGKLPDYIFKKNTTVTSTFSDEFNSLLGGQTSQWSEAKKAENVKKNRYGNLLPYDRCRVILEPLQGVTSSDYINASYIDGYNSTKEYIATQGPKENTSLDFWRMVWQENSSVIVMVTSLIESGKRKCAKYWPDDSIQYGDLQVLLIHTETCMDFMIRTILLRKNRETRRVRHYQFLDWPDNGIPSNAASLIMLQRRIRTDNPDNKSPIIVHCSAGIGRSGTFIAIDALRNQANEEYQVDVFSFVNKMRMQRINMVPTLEQYTFIYEVLSEAVLCGDTMVMADQLHMYVRHICSPQPNTDISEIKQQFETLSKIQQKTSISQCSDALNDINILKNRDPMIVPCKCHKQLCTYT